MKHQYAVLGVIPARYDSTRFPGKVLRTLRGRTLIEWVWRRASEAESLDEVWIATDDDRVADTARAFGARVVMTSRECASGSDRIAEAVADIDVGIVANIQGDEPLIDPETIDTAVEALIGDPHASVATACVEFARREDFENPNCVKVVLDNKGRALYFSRASIPSLARMEPVLDDLPVAVYKHVGLYVYRKEALLAFRGMEPGRLEQIEKLEQLRYLEHGRGIQVVRALRDSIGVDTPEELERLEREFPAELEE